MEILEVMMLSKRRWSKWERREEQRHYQRWNEGEALDYYSTSSDPSSFDPTLKHCEKKGRFRSKREYSKSSWEVVLKQQLYYL